MTDTVARFSTRTRLATSPGGAKAQTCLGQAKFTRILTTKTSWISKYPSARTISAQRFRALSTQQLQRATRTRNSGTLRHPAHPGGVIRRSVTASTTRSPVPIPKFINIHADSRSGLNTHRHPEPITQQPLTKTQRTHQRQ